MSGRSVLLLVPMTLGPPSRGARVTWKGALESAADIGALQVRTASGDMVRLDTVVSIRHGAGPININRTDRERSLLLTGNLEGVPLNRALETVETVLEAAYSFNLTSWLTITPDVQYIIRPSGVRSVDNAILAGVLVYLTF